MRDILIQGLAALGLTPPDGAVERLETYARMLLEQNQVMNLTAITQPKGVARLHFLDSAAVLAVGSTAPGREPRAMEDVGQADGDSPAVGDIGALRMGRTPCGDIGPYGWEKAEGGCSGTWLAGKSVIDVGTGAGFPGLVLKILEPSISLTLLDSLGKRVTWLETVCQALGLEDVRCLHARAEEQALEPGFRDSFDVAVSRAVASLPLLTELCLPYVRPGGVFLAMKSVDSAAETQAAEGAVKRLGGEALAPVDYPVPGAGVIHRLVGVRKASNTPKGYPRKWAKIKKEPL